MTKQRNKAKLSVVGAGPGDPELISLKAIKVLATADVVLYDALVSTDLLGYAPVSALKIFVGKRLGKHSCSQHEINEQIVRYAFQYGHVVRLKGGDPYIFGRGHEEIGYAQGFGLETHYVPGISSVTAVPGLQGIPLTRRGLSESFWVITGTTRTGGLSHDLYLAAQSTATVVILMGTAHLAEIMEIFVHHQQADTPVAIIQEGSLPGEKILTGKVSTIAREAKAFGIGSPASIVVGRTVPEHPHFREAVFQELSEQKLP
jgi:uroporphyrin-III C-methyltransferase